VDRTQYSDETEPIPWLVNEMASKKMKMAQYRCMEYLMREHVPGEVFFAKRGKQMVFAAGHVRVFYLLSSLSDADLFPSIALQYIGDSKGIL